MRLRRHRDVLLSHAFRDVDGESLEGTDEEHFDQCHGPGHALLETEQIDLCFTEVPLLLVRHWMGGEACRTYMRFEVLYAYVHSLEHVEEICLEDQGVAWMVEHARSVL